MRIRRIQLVLEWLLRANALTRSTGYLIINGEARGGFAVVAVSRP